MESIFEIPADLDTAHVRPTTLGPDCLPESVPGPQGDRLLANPLGTKVRAGDELAGAVS